MLALLLAASSALAQPGSLRIGVLALHGIPECRRQWAATAEYLNAAVSNCTFEVVPLDFDQIDRAVRYAEVDFVIANSSFYVTLNARYEVTRMATFRKRTASGLPFSYFGGVVFCRADRPDIHTAADLKGKRFMAVDPTSFGGWQMAWREFKELGIRPSRDFRPLEFAGTHEAVVQAVLDGRADAGTVRTDTLQRMTRTGRLKLDDLRIIPAYPHPLPAMPFLASTRLYPEWPFSRLRHVPDELAAEVTVALLEMPEDAPAAVNADGAGWTVPYNYETVHECLRELRVGPYTEYGRITAAGAIRQYWPALLGLLLLLVALASAVLAQWRAHRHLRDAHAMQRQILSTAATAVFTVDNQMRITGVNEAFCKVTGFAADDVVGKPCAVLEGRPCLDHCGLFDPQRTAPIVSRQCTLHTRDGRELTVLKNAAILHDGRGRPTGGIESFVDVTPLMEARVEAEAASRAKSDFLANMSHEIRTPMNAIIGMTDLALDTDLTAEQRDYLATVKHSADALLTLINDILDFSKIEAGRLELDEFNFNVRDTIEDTVRTLAVRAHEKRLELTCHVAPGVPENARGDAGRLRQILMNLVGNAIKFTESGEVSVAIEATTVDANGVCLHGQVRDTGIGISSDKQERIFDVFAQADASVTRTHGGTGLGLAICRQITALMRGRVWVQSPAPPDPSIQAAGGPGSVFHFTVCLKRGDAPAPRPRAMPDALNDLPVLVADDNATNRRLLGDMLRNWGMQPTLAASGPEAVKLAGQARDAGQPFRLLLSDCNMPDMDGFSTVEQVRALSPDTVSVMLTSGGRRGDSARCRQIGIVAYLMKPVKQSDLFDAIISVVAGEGDAEAERDLITRHSLRERARSLNLLLVEDNPVNRKLAVALLEKHGHRVVTAADGQESLVRLARERFDAVLMDIQMPVMDGLEATRRIRAGQSAVLDPQVPIVAMTAHAMQGDRETCLAAGMTDYISKPIRAEELLRTLRHLAGNGVEERAGRGEEENAAPGQQQAFRAALLERVDGDEALLRELVDLFLQTYPDLLRRLRADCENGDADDLARQAHTLKGMLGNFGTGPAFTLALELEQAGRGGCAGAEALDLFGRLDAAVEVLRADLLREVSA